MVTTTTTPVFVFFVCAEEGIKTKDLMVLGRKPDATRDAEKMPAAVALVKQKEKEEKELARQLQFQAICERQEQLIRERKLMVSHRRVLWMLHRLGQSEELDARCSSQGVEQVDILSLQYYTTFHGSVAVASWDVD